MDKFDEFAATAPPRPPTAPAGLDFYGIRPLAGMQQTPPMRLPMDMAGPMPPAGPAPLNYTEDPMMSIAPEPAPPRTRQGRKPARKRRAVP